MQQNHINRLCNDPIAISFVKKYAEDARKLAALINVPQENILGLAAQETQWGTGRIAVTYNNFFSMHAPAPLQTGSVPALRNPSVHVATFNSFHHCGQSFIARFGNDVRGIKDPVMFARALVKARFNTGNAKTGGRDDFIPFLVQIIKNTSIRLTCP